MIYGSFLGSTKKKQVDENGAGFQMEILIYLRQGKGLSP